jgi:lipopolysaccharide biosynthesis regulator YciM
MRTHIYGPAMPSNLVDPLFQSWKLATAIVEHKHQYLCDVNEYDPVDKENLVAKVLKTRNNQKTAKQSLKKLGRHIKGITKPETLKQSRLMKIEVPDGDEWKKVEDKEIMEEHLMEQNIEQFSHAEKTHSDIQTWRLN